MAKRPTLQEAKDEALRDPELRAAYDALAPSFELKRKMIALRKKAGLTQQQMAEKLGTKRSNISRLESLNSDVSPRLDTIENYARALGYSIQIGFEPSAAEQSL